MRPLLIRVLALAGVLLAGPLAASLPAPEDLDAALVRNVRAGFIDYDGLRADPAFVRYLAGMGTAEEADLVDPRDRLAFLINAYNALAIQGILDGRSPGTWRGRRAYFRRADYPLLGTPTSLDELARERLGALGEPRTHFAIVCGALACPRLASRAYAAAGIDDQLDEAARRFANDPTRNRYDVQRRIAFLSRIFATHEADFVKAAGSTQKYLAKFVADPAAAELLARDGFEVQYVPDDWDLNGIYRGRPE